MEQFQFVEDLRHFRLHEQSFLNICGMCHLFLSFLYSEIKLNLLILNKRTVLVIFGYFNPYVSTRPFC
jgi:hypothetical protein